MLSQMTGSLLGGRYRLEERLGAGGMGETFRALDTRLGRPVAVKLLHAYLASDPAFVRRLEREARIVASLSHPNIVGLFDHDAGDSQGGRPYLVMELVQGQDLRETLDRAAAQPGTANAAGGVPAGALPLGRALDIAQGLLRALAHAHAHGLVHRDVKPGNVLVASDGGVKLADFGIAQAPDEATVTRTGELLGSIHYAAPERMEGGPATPAADVYAAGVLFYRMLAGRLPYEGDLNAVVAGARRGAPPALSSLRGDLPAWLERVVRTALAADPQRRYPSAREMLLEFERGPEVERRAGEPTEAMRHSDPDATTVALRPSGPPTGPRTVPRVAHQGPRRYARPAAAALLAIGALALSAGLAAAMLAGRPSPSASLEGAVTATSPAPAPAAPAAPAAAGTAPGSSGQTVARTAVPAPSVQAPQVGRGTQSTPSPPAQGPLAAGATIPQLRDLRAALQASGGRGKVADVVNELRELEKKLLEGHPGDAQKEAAELRRKVEEWRRKGELDPTVADRVLALLAQIRT